MENSSSTEPEGMDVTAHPVFRDTFVLPSRPVEEFVNVLITWLENLLPGGIVWGFMRMGKTQAVRYIMRNINSLAGSKIPCYLFSAWDTSLQPVTENRLFQELLYAVGYKIPESGTAAIKRRRLIDFLIQQAESVGEHRVLLFIDEAQWLNTRQFRLLMDLHNQLKLADIRLVTILVGQPELVELKASMRSAGQGHLLGRFMTGVHRFEGIVSESDLTRLLWAMDAGSEYPKDSGTSYTEYFIPLAFGNGFRLEKSGHALWTTITDICEAQGYSTIGELPMQAVTALLRTLLVQLSLIDDPDLLVESSLICDVFDSVARHQVFDHLMSSKTYATRLAEAA